MRALAADHPDGPQYSGSGALFPIAYLSLNSACFLPSSCMQHAALCRAVTAVAPETGALASAPPHALPVGVLGLSSFKSKLILSMSLIPTRPLPAFRVPPSSPRVSIVCTNFVGMHTKALVCALVVALAAAPALASYQGRPYEHGFAQRALKQAPPPQVCVGGR